MATVMTVAKIRKQMILPPVVPRLATHSFLLQDALFLPQTHTRGSSGAW